MKKIKTLGVVGAGTMGAALAQKFAQEGFKVFLADLSMQQVERGLSGIRKMLAEGVERKVFTEEQAKTALSNISETDQLEDLKHCDLVVEAIFENFDAKCSLFKTLSGIVAADTVLATNTSSFSVTELAASVSNPERFIGLHYFFHAAKNRLVEIIPGEKTSQATLDACYRFSIQSGKDPIFTKDCYGFAVNRFFVPWLNESVRLLGETGASPAAIDAVCMKTFGIGMGPFALMNATGVPIALHAQRTLEVFGPAYKPSERLEQQVENGGNWNLDADASGLPEEVEKTIRERMLGCTFFVCSQILEAEVCSPAELNRGAKIGLRWRKGPVELMGQYGENEVQRLVEQYANLYGEKVPSGIAAGNWKMEYVTLDVRGDRAIITLARPEDLNALNEEVVAQLDQKFSIADADPAVKTIFITGSGKAFVAGADIRFFVKNMKSHTLDKIVAFTKYGQEVFDKIDHSSKKVVALLDGLALGGGLELALCADILLATPKAMMAFPETGIGIYPGLGGTQRTAKKVGKGLAKYLILTGKMMNAKDAAGIGLVDAAISQEEAFDLLDGKIALPQPGKIKLSEKWAALAYLYERNTFSSIISGGYVNGNLSSEEVAKLGSTMRRKAPVAMQIAEQLIEAGQGPASELEQLTTIFNTSDAMLGLTSIGKRVEYEGK
ncbi:MAG: 3-hydroxyacyl-CoA dehydrogenase/enoyl-CoA hydratase family protein [Saprospiraceae bacterium]|nr:3-hydroxyacyl-CoA dehydrogenase/enoyl-CoA hydratase family protein [Saprospiraceae bacterium]MCF8249005.1 3-hydroxyacyl-CoA dehydrogenase/enoyl-CoA hydratase family protein [Saprospiraceae bacterium]MCF8283250.1 3-hydroxyacyl-CoA dehydrogenase/enoyl-CoA hydratase family protein [Bacteroidales bacterium]MCF8310899.1 3-hydroxyacyl-CoA dehydrogenase/enoyl-CoA hydratase family protein [Saprospiraceae bacterium]MCF8439513.1 3-hydroxyacyl-CoA dehydrogenase/enoyl-CoA hydratase family protein [Sapro